MSRFIHYVLRTTDAEAARGFYASVLGRDDAVIFPLHEQALARGARPHWLGMLEVDAMGAALSAFGARGATPLGPTWVNPQGLEGAVVRDPGGAVVGLGKPPNGFRAQGPDVAFHVLNTADVERAKKNYGELFGWSFGEASHLGELGTVHPFSWESGAVVGVMSDIAGRPGVHPHWLFHFRVDALEPALEKVRAAGGAIVGPLTLPSGARLAVCDDPQGAAFALLDGALPIL